MASCTPFRGLYVYCYSNLTACGLSGSRTIWSSTFAPSSRPSVRRASSSTPAPPGDCVDITGHWARTTRARRSRRAAGSARRRGPAASRSCAGTTSAGRRSSTATGGRHRTEASASHQLPSQHFPATAPAPATIPSQVGLFLS